MAGFRRITGIEFSPCLAAAARKHLGRARVSRCVNWEIQVGDAVEFEIPNHPVVLFLYNPFGGETLRRFAEKVGQRAAQPCAPLWLIYLNPKWISDFERMGLVIGARVFKGKQLAGAVLTPQA
jgi:hypothetical protein